MRTFRERRCFECGKGTLRKVAKRGRRERYKTMTLEIPPQIGIPTCDKCGTEWMDEDTAEEITNGLAVVYRERLHEMIDSALRILLEYTTVGHLEELFGLSKGYVSRLRARQKDPRPSLASALRLAAIDPKKRLKELEEGWEQRAS